MAVFPSGLLARRVVIYAGDAEVGDSSGLISPRGNLLPRCGPSRRGAGRRASFCRPDPWRAPPPTLQRLGEYLQTLQGSSSSWRTCSAQALRMYLLHVGKPELADVVWLPRHRKDA